MIQRGYRYKLHPTTEQERLFAQFAGVCRLVYNIAFEQRREHWRQYHRANGKNISMSAKRMMEETGPLSGDCMVIFNKGVHAIFFGLT